jgi:hypothetical protein
VYREKTLKQNIPLRVNLWIEAFLKNTGVTPIHGRNNLLPKIALHEVRVYSLEVMVLKTPTHWSPRSHNIKKQLPDPTPQLLPAKTEQVPCSNRLPFYVVSLLDSTTSLLSKPPQTAMRDDAEATLAYMQSLLIENEELKCKLDATNEQLEFEKVHLEKTVEVYEELQSIARAKEYVLMQQIQRLNVSENSPKSPLSEPITCIEVGEEEGSSLLQGGPSGESPKLDPNAVSLLP